MEQIAALLHKNRSCRRRATATRYGTRANSGSLQPRFTAISELQLTRNFVGKAPLEKVEPGFGDFKADRGKLLAFAQTYTRYFGPIPQGLELEETIISCLNTVAQKENAHENNIAICDNGHIIVKRERDLVNNWIWIGADPDPFTAWCAAKLNTIFDEQSSEIDTMIDYTAQRIYECDESDEDFAENKASCEEDIRQLKAYKKHVNKILKRGKKIKDNFSSGYTDVAIMARMVNYAHQHFHWKDYDVSEDYNGQHPGVLYGLNFDMPECLDNHLQCIYEGDIDGILLITTYGDTIRRTDTNLLTLLDFIAAFDFESKTFCIYDTDPGTVQSFIDIIYLYFGIRARSIHRTIQREKIDRWTSKTTCEKITFEFNPDTHD